jgi:putative serine protease PepD
MTETPDLPSTPEQPGPAGQETDRELVPAAVLPQQGEAASAPETTTSLPVEPATAPLASPPQTPGDATPDNATPGDAVPQSANGAGGGSAAGWLQEPPASLAPPSAPGAAPAYPAPAPVPPAAQAPAPAPQSAPYPTPAPYPAAAAQGQAPVAYPAAAQGQAPAAYPAAPQSQAQAPAPYPAAAPDTAPVPAFAAEQPAPSWAAPDSGGLPPYGEGPAPIGFESAPAKPKKNRTVLTAAIVAAIVGGGVGAGISYAVSGNSGNDVTSSTSINSDGLNTGSANASAVTAVSKKVLPSVVTITVEQTASAAANSNSSDEEEGDIGTGVILSSTGEILTNNHVISLAAAGGYTITVTFDGGANAPATIVDRDPTSDLAVIQASGVSGLTPATLGDSTTVQVGEQVVAIGAPLGMANTVTSGIVSALNRPVIPEEEDSSGSSSTTATTSTTALDAIQTDAAINPGNSGGPLVDMNGDVVGIDSAIASTGSDSLSEDSQSGSIGIGFAIPISQAKPVIQELLAKQTPTHSVLGVTIGDSSATATHTGAMLETVTSGGAAAKAGLQTGDEITKVDDQEIDSSDALEAAVHSYRPDTTVTVTYIRGGATKTANVTLGSATDSSS